ncbi:ANKRD17 [Symbiodinium natans]|uniref:ANKRD17 protein n=1 Tax=Symbiodinium natans TaxID=878477 RepID=A0A812SE26_9DINO|nr:ANKRD17 [Symbiodinium natans]
MTLLPSIMSTSHLAQGHVYRTTSMPPRSRTSSPKELPRHPSLELSTRSRTRTEWLQVNHAKTSGEIRNIQVLGIIHGNLVVSFQGSGRVRVFVNNEHSLELPETNRLGSTSPFGIDWTKKYSKYIINSHGLRFAEFSLKALPAQILVVGETAPSDEKLIPAAKPIIEAEATRCPQNYFERAWTEPKCLSSVWNAFDLFGPAVAYSYLFCSCYCCSRKSRMNKLGGKCAITR